MSFNKLDPDFKQRWVAALRSGKYKQGRGELYSAKTDTYCCLGVACAIQGIGNSELNGKLVPNNLGDNILDTHKIPTIFRDGTETSRKFITACTFRNDGASEWHNNPLSFNDISYYIQSEL